MSATDQEVEITHRVAEQPKLEVEKIKEAQPRQLAIRFVAGAVTSIVAGVVTLVFGARTGGIFLAFPAILAASLTLIEKQEDAAEAREDARGAVMGGGAMALFALVAAISFGSLSPALALLLAAAAWLIGALTGYVVAWFR